MEASILSITNQEKGKRRLPSQFDEVIRPDLIKRAVLSIRSRARKPYGSNPEAGQRHSAKLSRRRRDYRGSYGLGISRVPRKILSRRGMRMSWVGAEAPGTRGGRRAHPPKPGKDWEQSINKKENRKAIRSGLAATVKRECVEKIGYKLPAKYPIIMENNFEQIANTKKLREALKNLGIELRTERKIRSGKGKTRARKYRTSRGMLIIVSKDCPLIKAARNLEGVETCQIKKVNADVLAPGCEPGRLTIYTAESIDMLEKEKLFI